MDIVEDVEGYTIFAELPGIKREDVKLTMEEGVLKLRGERKRFIEDTNKTFHRVERSFGTFTRTFTLPNLISEHLGVGHVIPELIPFFGEAQDVVDATDPRSVLRRRPLP